MINFLYRQYCKYRNHEERKRLLVDTKNKGINTSNKTAKAGD